LTSNLADLQLGTALKSNQLVHALTDEHQEVLRGKTWDVQSLILGILTDGIAAAFTSRILSSRR